MPVLRLNELVAQLEPATQLFWRSINSSRPAAMRHRSAYFGKARLLSQAQQHHSGAFEKAELEIARIGITHNHVANQRLRSEEHTSELQSRFGISYAVFCLKK